jgi:inorganic phosphate transporter, PiT family
MVILFEATNGFHDAANAVATVIYTKSLQPGPAVVLSGVMNFIGVLTGGIAVECIGRSCGKHLTPAQGASTEIVSAILIGTAGFTGLPVSTTHIVLHSAHRLTHLRVITAGDGRFEATSAS